MKVTLDGYRKIQQYKELGLSKAKTAEKMKISRFAVARWWDRTEDEFAESSRTSFMYLDSYKEFFLEQIRTYPCIRSTNLYYKTEEAFPDFKCTRERFFIEFLKDILSAELDIRKQNALIKREKEAKLPSSRFVKTALNSGAVWQVEKLESLDWIEEDQNLIILGNCATGKTAFASHIGRKALEAGNRVAYTTLEDYLLTVRNKGRREPDRKRFQYYLSCSLIIIDEVMYTTLYQSSMLLNETRSIVLITNRELSSWQEAAEDKHLMQTLVARLTSNSQILRL